MPGLSRILPLLVAVTITLTSTARPQSDRSVTTARIKPGGAQLILPEGGKVNLSDIPRYYLDTIDNLNRVTTDLTRTAPGMVKNNYIGKVYEVFNARAIQIQSYLLRLVAFEGGTVEVMAKLGVKNKDGQPVEFLFVSAPDFMIPGIDEIVQRCDVTGFAFYDGTADDFGGGSGAVRYVGKHRTASELVSILSGTELGNVGAFLFPPFADDSTNSIYIVENPADIADDIAALELFDKPPLQVELEVVIYEIDDDGGSYLGVNWQAWLQFISGSFTYVSNSNHSFFDDGGDGFLTILTLDARALARFLGFMVSEGHGQILTQAKITMVNSEDLPGGLSGGARGASTGVPAVIEHRTPLAFIQPKSSEEDSQIDEITVTQGVRVEILPFIGSESITLVIDAHVDTLVGLSPVNNIPLISEKNTHSVVNLRSGNLLVLAGMERSAETRTIVGVPFLKDIPLLGWLFRVETRHRKETQIFITIKATLKDASQSEAPHAEVELPWRR